MRRTLNNGSMSAPIFAGNNTGNSVDILSPPSFLLARDPYTDAYEMHGHADITYVASRGGKSVFLEIKLAICPCFSTTLIQAPFISSHYLRATSKNVRASNRHREYFKGSTHMHHLACRTDARKYHFPGARSAA